MYTILFEKSYSENGVFSTNEYPGSIGVQHFFWMKKWRMSLRFADNTKLEKVATTTEDKIKNQNEKVKHREDNIEISCYTR